MGKKEKGKVSKRKKEDLKGKWGVVRHDKEGAKH